MIQRTPRCLVMAALGIFACATVTYAENVTLATNRVPQKTIVYPANSGTNIQNLATELAGFLNRITTGTFTTGSFAPATGPAASTIVLGLASDLNLSGTIPNANIKDAEHYIIGAANSSSNVVIAGATERAVTDAVYDWLNTLGCRWFFPTAKWEIIPSNINLKWTTASTPTGTMSFSIGSKSMTMNIYHNEKPDYKSRWIWFPYYNATGSNAPFGEWMQQWTELLAWNKRNKNVEGIKINFYHNYEGIVTWAKSQTTNPNTTPPTTRWKPEYHAMINGSRLAPPPKQQKYYQLCAGNPEVVQLCKDYATWWFQTYPTEVSVSMEPNDGMDWCDETCTVCAANLPANHTISDKTLYLANAVAEELATNWPNKFVGLLAYSNHADVPTTLPGDGVHDRIYLNIATGYLMFGKTFEQLLVEWSARTPNVGVYDYFSNFTWDMGLPNKSDGSDLSYIAEDFPAWYALKADNYNSQSTYSWGMLGLGHYIAMKVLWNTSVDVEALKQDFLTKCFGSAVTPMTEFYRHIDKGEGYRLSTDLIGRLYGYLDAAYTAAASDEVVKQRLDDLALYVRSCELRREWEATNGEDIDDRTFSASAALSHAWKMRSTSMLDTLSLWRIKPVWSDSYPNCGYTDQFEWPTNTVPWYQVYTGKDANGDNIYQDFAVGEYELEWEVPMNNSINPNMAEENHPWKVLASGTYSRGDILGMVTAGIAANPLLIEEPRSFSSDLVPSGMPAVSGTWRGSLTVGARVRTFAYYIRTGSTGATPVLTMSTGWTETTKGPLVYELTAANGDRLPDVEGVYIWSGTIPENRVDHVVGWTDLEPYTVYRLNCNDFGSYSHVTWSGSAQEKQVTMIADSECGYNQTGGQSHRYFYVPKGTQNVLMYAGSINAFKVYSGTSSTLLYSSTASIGPGWLSQADITISVPAGEDGKIWDIRGLIGMDIFFQNIPGLMAVSPDELLIPKDALGELQPSGAAASTRGSFIKMYIKNAFYIRKDVNGSLPVFTISNGWSSPAYGDAEWTLYSEDGKTTYDTGVIPNNKLNYNPAFTNANASSQDTFLLVYNDKKGNSKIEWPSGSYVSIVADSNYNHTQSGGASRRYFFVPKGTANVSYKAKGMLACTIYNAAGVLRHTQVAQSVPFENSFAVPEGEDDQFWYAVSFGGTEFRFLNIPGLLGTNPNEMLIPRWTFMD